MACNRKRMSFTSGMLATGCLPTETDPTINILISFDSIQACPTEKDIVCIVPLLFKYDRMSGIPRSEARWFRQSEWYFENNRLPIEPEKMVRTFDVTCDTNRALEEAVDQQSLLSLRDKSRNLPWWEFILLRNKGKGESILVLRVDHTIGGGFSMGKICATFLTNADGSPMENLMPASMRGRKNTIFKNQGMNKYWMVMRALLEVSWLPFSKSDHSTAFSKNSIGKNVERSHKQRTAFFEPIPLDYVKAIKNSAGVSLNDVLMTALSLAIYEYCRYNQCSELRSHGEKTLCRATMMYGFPSENDDANSQINNAWSPLSVNLGIGLRNIRDRLAHMRTSTMRLKSTPIAHCQRFLQNSVVPFLPLSVMRKLAYKVTSKHSLIVTNVPGPQKKVLLCNKPVSTCRASAFQMDPVITILSYDGQIHITLVADSNFIPNLECFSIFFIKALVNLGDEMNISPPIQLKDSLKAEEFDLNICNQ